MALRTNTAKVIAVLGRDYDGKSDLNGPIAVANSLTTRTINAAANEDGISVSSSDAELMERLLSAHFSRMNDPQYKSRSTLSASGNWRGEDGKGLDATTYGQNAQGMDPTGGWLRAIFNGQVVGGGWLGKPVDEQLSYNERNGVV